jgi:thioesterase domain-containing protein
MHPDDITRYAHQHIPITQHMGIKVLAIDIDNLAISVVAPYAPNINHRETLFGGSISTLGILSGWSLLWAVLQDNTIPNRLVIQSSNTQFIKPADADIVAQCSMEPSNWSEFRSMLQRRGKARISLNAEITCKDIVVATHTGQYVAIKT